jgi:hypothetical protein
MTTTSNPFATAAAQPEEPEEPTQTAPEPTKTAPPKAKATKTASTPPAAEPAPATAAPRAAAAARPGTDKFSAAGDVDDPFASPRGVGSGERITERVGELLLVKPIELLHDIPTDLGPADPMLVDFAVLTGEDEGHVAEGALVYGKVLINELQRVLDGPQPFLLGRLEVGTAKSGKNPPWVFARPEEDDVKIARAFLKSTNF